MKTRRLPNKLAEKGGRIWRIFARVRYMHVFMHVLINMTMDFIQTPPLTTTRYRIRILFLSPSYDGHSSGNFKICCVGGIYQHMRIEHAAALSRGIVHFVQ